jgi:Na+-translocating ferredoxin:NAD+ oxidoreductase RnfE subunit
MSKLTIQGHFRYLHFKTFSTTPRTPQCKVFCPLLSSSEHSGVLEDSNSQLFQVLGFTPTLGQSRGATPEDSNTQLFQVLGFTPTLGQSRGATPEDSNSQLFQVLGFTPTLGHSRGATKTNGSSTCNSKLLKVEILGIRIQKIQELGKCKSN